MAGHQTNTTKVRREDIETHIYPHTGFDSFDQSKINDMNKETASSYERLEELVRELDKRIRTYKERGGKYDDDESADVIYAMMDEPLKKDARRCKVVGDADALRDHVRDEAAEGRESKGHKGKKDKDAMDISAVEQDKGKEEQAAASQAASALPTPPAQAAAPEGSVYKLSKDQCKICLQTGHWGNECPMNKGMGKGKGDKGKGKGKGSWKGGKGDKGKGKGKGKFGWNKGSGKGKGVYGLEDSQWWYGAEEQWNDQSEDWWSGSSGGASGGFYSIVATGPRANPAGRLSALSFSNSRARPESFVNPFARIFGPESWADVSESEAESEHGSSGSSESGVVSLADGSGCFDVTGDGADIVSAQGSTKAGGGTLVVLDNEGFYSISESLIFLQIVAKLTQHI